VTITVEVVPQQDYRLGRQMVHDERSRAFPLARTAIDRSSWKDKAIRIYDPLPNPNQCHGECTGCAECIMLNAIGNRVTGRVLRMCEAHKVYAYASQNDPWDGGMKVVGTCHIEGEDTGSSGLSAAKASVKYGYAVDYLWEFGGADGVIQQVMTGRPISVGTWWYWDMFRPDSKGFVRPTGGMAGGHQWVVRGYDVSDDAAIGRCWWGDFRDFKIKRTDLDNLLRDGGDAHFTRSVA